MKRMRWPSGVQVFACYGKILVGVDCGFDLLGPYVDLLSFDGIGWKVHPCVVFALNDDAHAMLAIAKQGGGR